MPKNKFQNALGLDVGEKRIGVARINSVALIPEPLITLANNQEFSHKLADLIRTHEANLLVVGLPRNMSGQETAQTQIIKDFVETILKPNLNTPIIYQDETLSSVEAHTYPEETIKNKGIDAIAAAEILRYFAQGK